MHLYRYMPSKTGPISILVSVSVLIPLRISNIKLQVPPIDTHHVYYTFNHPLNKFPVSNNAK